MSTYKVTGKDLVGDIVGFPIEVVQKMLERQTEQGNKENVKVFQVNACTSKFCKGFDWRETKEGDIFWHNIIITKKFDVFFDKYPKNHYVYIYQDGTKNGDDIIKTLKERGGNNERNFLGSGIKLYYYIHPTNKCIRAVPHIDELVFWLKTFYTEIDVESSIKEYTLQEIADKLGINVNELRIKK